MALAAAESRAEGTDLGTARQSTAGNRLSQLGGDTNWPGRNIGCKMSGHWPCFWADEDKAELSHRDMKLNPGQSLCLLHL